MQLDSLRALWRVELNGLYDAESQLAQALPDLAKAACSEDLRLTFERHLDQTREHLQRLTGIGTLTKRKLARMTCKAMAGILEEAEDLIQAHGDPAIKDAALISVAQRIEHYEMARYGCARTYAEMLGEDECADLLQETLNDERATDECLTDLAERLIGVETVPA